jgi:hypothetical protein
MNKFWKLTSIIAVLVAVVAFAGITAAFAQGPNQPDDITPSGGNRAQHGAGAGLGVMAVDEATMHAAIAEALDMSVEAFEAAIAEGKTPFVLAQELGIDFADVQAAMQSVHTEALQQAVDDGLITQEQYDWIRSRSGGQGRQANGLNGGLGNGSMRRMGGGTAGNGGFGGDCPYVNP